MRYDKKRAALDTLRDLELEHQNHLSTEGVSTVHTTYSTSTDSRTSSTTAPASEPSRPEPSRPEPDHTEWQESEVRILNREILRLRDLLRWAALLLVLSWALIWVLAI